MKTGQHTTRSIYGRGKIDPGFDRWVELGGDAGFRPVVIVSRNANRRREKVTVAEITRTIRSLPSEVLLDIGDGMTRKCVIATDNLLTIPRDSLRERITQLSPELLVQLDSALKYALGIDW